MLALFVSITQTRILSQEKHASVWPHLQIGQGWDAKNGAYSLTVSNSGIGPAIIQDAEFHYQDTVFTTIQGFLTYVSKKENLSFDVTHNNIEYMNVIPEGDVRNLIKIKEDSLAAETVIRYRGNLDVIINYCSIYGKCWQLKDSSTKKTKLKSKFKNLIY